MNQKKGKVLFIVHDVYQEDNDFPLGIAYLAAVLKRAGAEVKVCCQDIFHYSNEEMAEKFLKNEEYDLIGVGFLAARFKETVLGICETINKYKKKRLADFGRSRSLANTGICLGENKGRRSGDRGSGRNDY